MGGLPIRKRVFIFALIHDFAVKVSFYFAFLILALTLLVCSHIISVLQILHI